MQFCEDHSEAISYDLITRTTYQLDDAGGALSWSSLNAFVKNLGSDSALARDLGKQTGWEDTLKTNAILADIYDLLQAVYITLVSMATNGKTKKHLKPYPRPGKDENNTRKIGKGALPFKDLRDWIKERQHG